MFKLNQLVAVHYAHMFCERCRGEVRLAAMALLCYTYMTVFRRRIAELPDSAGPLSSSLPSMAIEQANVAITRATNATLSVHIHCTHPTSPATSSKR